MTNEERESLETIKGTGGFRIIEYLAKQQVEKLNDVSTIPEENTAAVALGKKYASIAFKDFLTDLGLYSEVKPKINKTYE